jgi:hypothetical protein
MCPLSTSAIGCLSLELQLLVGRVAGAHSCLARLATVPVRAEVFELLAYPLLLLLLL